MTVRGAGIGGPGAPAPPGCDVPANAPLASVVVVATDELHHLRDCLPSLALLAGPSTEVVVVDNASQDGTASALAAEYPWVRVVCSERRLGYAPANNLGFRHARGAYLVVLNPDTRVDRHFGGELVAASRRWGDRALVTSRICMFDRPEVVNTCGIDVHFGLIAACHGLGRAASEFTDVEEVASVSGCAFLIPRSMLLDIGPFDDAVYPYLEDTELSLRARAFGYRCLVAPRSVVYHKYRIRLTPAKFFHIERNRWLVMLRLYRLPTLLCLAPALLVVEATAWAYAATLGPPHLAAKARSYVAVTRMLGTTLADRRRVQPLRRQGDRALLRHLMGRLPAGQLAERQVVRVAMAIANVGLDGYFRIVQQVVRW